MRQIVLDTETTGLKPEDGHRVIEIGCVELVDRKLTGRHFHQYLNPERDSDAEAEAVHGLTKAFLQDKPVFASIADAFLEFVAGAELIIHNAPFDMGFLNQELSKLKANVDLSSQCSVSDSLMMAKQLYPGQRNSLDVLCSRLGVDNASRELHGALLDAQLLAQVYLLMTGGQVAMDLELQTTKPKTENIVSPAVSGQSLKVLYVSPEELARHDDFIKTLRV